MKSLWNDVEAARCRSELALRVYSSRLLGRDQSLVLHGGGNTSVKLKQRNAVGEEEDILHVKGSGWDLETIEAPGFAPVRMAHLLKLARFQRTARSSLKTHNNAQAIVAGSRGREPQSNRESFNG